MGQATQIILQHARLGRGWSGKPRGDSEAAQHFLQRPRELPDGHGLPAQFVFEVVEDSLGGMPDELRIEQLCGVARQFHPDHIRRIRDAFTGRQFKEQTIGGQRDHCLPSSFLTSCTKSVASWKRR